MMFVLIAFAVALFFAMNIGASGAAASMGIAYGSGAIKKRKVALFISAIGVFIGGAIGGAEVIKTIGSGIVPSSILSVKIAIIILAGATITLFISNVLGIPLSTSEVTVGSVIGVGIAYQAIYFGNVIYIVAWWFLIPVIAFALAFFVGKMILWLEKIYPGINDKKFHKWFVFLVIIAGFLEAVSAGMNNVANAVGPLVGAGLLSISDGMLIGGLFVALGAFLLGSKVVETNGKKITNLSLLQGMTVSGTSAFLVILASIFGIPVPLTQVTTTGILGIGASKSKDNIFKKTIIKKILTVWIVSPVFSLAVSFGLVKIFLENDFYTLLALISVFFATVGTMVLMKITKKEKQQFHEHGGGI